MTRREQLDALIAQGQELWQSMSIGAEATWPTQESRGTAKGFLLEAPAEVEKRQAELWAEFETAVGLNPAVAYESHWARSRKKVVTGTEWYCNFHGVEYDFHNSSDGRFLSLDLLPVGVIGITSIRGMTVFLHATRTPWREFPALRDLVCASQREGFKRLLVLVWELVQEEQLVCLPGDALD